MNVDQSHPTFRRFKRDLTSGSHTITINFKSNDSRATAYMSDASLTVTKVNILTS